MGVLVRKANGELEEFLPDKLRHSLDNAGAPSELVEQILSSVTSNISEGSSTKDIYKKAFALLKAHSHKVAASYHLKNAVMELGPSGYPFEHFLGRILENQGYEVQVGVVLSGYCVDHEVDVLARKGDVVNIIECKFRNRPGIKCDVKVPLYIKSRFDDVVKGLQKQKAYKGLDFKGWVATNTKFTVDAFKYGKCVGLYMLGWDEPYRGSLKNRIAYGGLHPLTCLSNLTEKEKDVFLNSGIVLCREIPDNMRLLDSLDMSPKRKQQVLNDIEELVNGTQED